ncbi:MAG: RsmD family RNA methyltransferase [Bacteroidales bacterium]|nr:RsmD family RNA methyltransferase [Bacteroidales bacterium]
MRIIRGKYGRRRFQVPTNITARPTTDFARENIFNVIENMVDLDGATALDLFAGTGAVSFELLSRGCSSVTSVEKAATQARFIQKVAGELKAGDTHSLVRGDALKFVASSRRHYDLIFADPPYDMPNFDAVAPAVIAMVEKSSGPTLFILEHSAKHDYSHLQYFHSHRAYGSVNFSLFLIENPGNPENPESLPPQ